MEGGGGLRYFFDLSYAMRTADPTVHLTYLFLGCGITIISINVQTKYQCHVFCHTLIIICDVHNIFYSM